MQQTQKKTTRASAPHVYFNQYNTNRCWVEIVGLRSSSRVTVEVLDGS